MLRTNLAHKIQRTIDRLVILVLVKVLVVRAVPAQRRVM
jgi:hypothetical protein